MTIPLRVLYDEFTFEAADVAGSFAEFVPFTDDGFLDLENSRIRIGGLITPALSNTVTLSKVLGVSEQFTMTTTSGLATVVTAKTGLIIGQTVAGVGIAPANTFNASVTNASTAVATTQLGLGLVVGQTVTGTGIQNGTTITAVVPGTGFTLSLAANATNAVVSLSVAAPTITAISATGFTMSINATVSGTNVCTVSGAAPITTATTVAATAATAAAANQSVAFTPLNGGPAVTFKKGDRLRLTLTTPSQLGVGRTLQVTIPIQQRMGPGLAP